MPLHTPRITLRTPKVKTVAESPVNSSWVKSSQGGGAAGWLLQRDFAPTDTGAGRSTEERSCQLHSAMSRRRGAAAAAASRGVLFTKGGVHGLEECDFSTDLLVAVDDATLDVGRVRFRPGGGTGGHKGLKSVSGVLGTESYARLRLGVGLAPEGTDLTDWVLSSMSEDDESAVVGILPELSEAVEVWMRDGIEEVMNQFNR